MCCDNDFLPSRCSMKRLLCGCMKKVERVYFLMEQEGGGDVLCLDVGQASLHERLLESAARKIIKGLALLFLEHLVLKQKVSSVSSI